MPWNRPRWRTESNHGSRTRPHCRCPNAGCWSSRPRPSHAHIPVTTMPSDARLYVSRHTSGICPQASSPHHQPRETLVGTPAEHGPQRASSTAPRPLRELLRHLLRHPLEQARGELKHWVFWASLQPHPRDHGTSPGRFAGRRPDILQDHRAGYSTPGLVGGPTTGSKSPSAWLRLPPTSTTSPP